MTVTNASSTALPLEIGLTQNYLVEQRNTLISQMEIILIKMRLQPFHSMDLVLKSGLKSSQLGLADVKIDGKSVGELDFYTAGATEKRCIDRTLHKSILRSSI